MLITETMSENYFNSLECLLMSLFLQNDGSCGLMKNKMVMGICFPGWIEAENKTEC